MEGIIFWPDVVFLVVFSVDFVGAIFVLAKLYVALIYAKHESMLFDLPQCERLNCCFNIKC